MSPVPFGWGDYTDIPIRGRTGSRIWSPVPFGWGDYTDLRLRQAIERRAKGLQCLSAGGTIRTGVKCHKEDGTICLQCLSAGGTIRTTVEKNKLKKGTASLQCLSAGGTIRTNPRTIRSWEQGTVSSAFRLGGLYGLGLPFFFTGAVASSPVPFGWGDYTDTPTALGPQPPARVSSAFRLGGLYGPTAPSTEAAALLGVSSAFRLGGLYGPFKKS